MPEENTSVPTTGGQDVSAPAPVSAPAGQASSQASEPFYSYKGVKGDEVYHTKEELDKAMRENFLRQSDYTRKTQEISNYRKQFEDERKKFSEEQKAFLQSRQKYDQWDQLLKTRPDVYQQLERLASGPPDPSAVFERSKGYADEKTQELVARLEAIEKEREEERTKRELDEIFSKKSTQYEDFDKDGVMEMLELLKDGNTEPLVDVLHWARKGRMNPLETEKKITEKLQKKADAGLVPGRSAAPKGKPQYSSIDEAAQAALRAVGGG